MQVDILGNGAIGNLLVLRCIQLNLDFNLVTRDGQRPDLTLTSISGKKHSVRPDARSINQRPKAGITILPLKAYQILPAIEEMRPFINPDQVLVLLHNGMGTIEQIRAVLPDQPIIAATTSYGSYKPSHFEMIATGEGQTHAGWLGTPKSDSAIETLFSMLLPPCKWHENIQSALWQKLSVNAVINPLSAIANIKNGGLKDQVFDDEIDLICAETAMVMNAEGYPTSKPSLLEYVNQVIENTADNYSSMRQDLVNQRQTEIEYINGYIVKCATRQGLHVPKNLELIEHINNLAKG